MRGTRAAIYARISRDAEGRELGVQRQEEDCRRKADAEGLSVVSVYVDNDRSASTRSKKPRPEYSRMLADAEAGRFDVILAYSNSRITRRPIEYENLIQLHERTGVSIRTVVSGASDLSTADGRHMARMLAANDAAEPDRTAERVARKHKEKREKGLPVGGPRPFGWREDRLALDPIEAELIRAAIVDVLAGVRPAKIAERWNEEGTTTSVGGPWSGETVKRVLRSPRVAGWRVYQRAVAIDSSGAPIRAAWEPIVDDETWRAVVAALRQPERRSRIPRKGGRQRLLTGTIRCGVCGRPMYGSKGSRGYAYRCNESRSQPGLASHSNSVSTAAADAWATRHVLSAAALVTETAVPPERTARLVEIAEEIETHTGLIDDVMEGFRRRELPADVAFKNVGLIEAERDRLAAERDDIEAELRASRAEALTPERWEELDTDRRRAVVEQWFEAIYVRPAERRSPVFDESRLEGVWKAKTHLS